MACRGRPAYSRLRSHTRTRHCALNCQYGYFDGMLRVAFSSLLRSGAVFDSLVAKRAKRLVQIASLTLVGLSIAALLAGGTVRLVLIGGVLGMLLSGVLAWRGRTLASASILLLDLLIMLSSLVWVSGGIRDLAMLGYPGLLVFAVILGNARIFVAMLLAIVLYCTLLAVLTVHGYFTIELPPVTYAHIFFVNIIFLLTGFSVYVLVKDLHRLMAMLNREIKQSREREDVVSELARRDQLTGLYNRRDAEMRFALMMQEADREGCNLAVFFIDLDNFKPVNDSLGHAIGDLLLLELSRRLMEELAPRELLYRFGGDEFLLIRTKLPADGEAWQGILEGRAQQLLDTIGQPMHIMQNTLVTTASIGVAIAPLHASSFVEISRLADLAMYEAKQSGRNAFCLYHEGLGRASIDKFLMLKRIQHALEQQQFQLWYQPKVCLATGRILGAEALLRWPQADGSFISPEVFVPLAESSGLISELGRWVAERAIRDCANWHAQGFTEVSVSINVSPVQFRCSQLPSHVHDLLCDTGLPAASLELELTESLLIDDGVDIRQQLDEMSRQGVGLAIDDFGTGYSNISYLNRFCAQRLKIDKSFILPLADPDADIRLVRAMLMIADSLGFKVVAEGVENEVCRKRLQQLGCTEGQGYLWSPALPMDRWLAFLRKSSQ